MKRILVIIIAVVGLSIPTMAQRLLPHQKGIEFYGGVPLQKHKTFETVISMPDLILQGISATITIIISD